MKSLQSIILLNFLFQLTNCLFIRSNAVYSSIIKDVYDFHYCKSITILYTDSNSGKIKEMELNTRLMNLQLNFSKLLISTSMMNIKTFISKKNSIVNNINKSLIVFLDDSEDMKYHVKKLINQWSDLSKSTWLIFFDDATELNNFFKNIYIPFNSQFMVSKTNDTNQYSEIIFEIFKVDRKSELFCNIFGTWNSETGVQFPKLGLHYRRNQLYGLNLRTAKIHTLPTMSMTYNRRIEVEKIFGQVIDILKTAMNFSVTYVVTDQSGITFNKRWISEVRLLANNELDFFPVYLGITRLRVDAIDYTKPLFLSMGRFFYSVPPPQLTWSQFLKPFSNGIWITIILFIPLIGIFLTILEFMNRNPNGKFFTKTVLITMVKNMVFAANAFCGKTIPRSKIDSIAIVQCVLYLAVIVLLGAYSGVFISSLTNDNDIPQFETIQDFHDESTYTMGLLEGSLYHYLFQNSTDKMITQMIKKTIQRNALTTSNKQGFARACSDHTYAFYTTDITRYFSNPKNCILLASKPIMKLSVSFGMQRHSPYKNTMDYYISLFRNCGILKRIFKNWAEYNTQQKKNPWKPVELPDIAALLVYFHIAVIFSIFILWGERITYKRHKQRKLATVFQRLITNTKYPMDDNFLVPIK